jgi:hypothetical protein
MYIQLNKPMTWQEKRIKAMNRIVKKSKTKKETTEQYLAEYNRVCVSSAKNKREYKGENNDQTIYRK